MRKYPLALMIVVGALGTHGTASSQVAVLNETVQERRARPGERYSGVILVKNTTNEPQEIKVYQTDYSFAADGTSRYGDPGSMPRSNARWITLGPSRLVIPAGAETRVGYTTNVPTAGAAPLSGSYWSMIMVEAIPAESAESSRAPSRGRRGEIGIATRLRYAVQVATHLPEGGSPAVDFANPRATTTPQGGKRFEFDVVNTGTLAYRPRVRVELFDGEGAPAGQIASERGLLYPGTSLRQGFDLGAVRPGRYQLLVVVDTGGESVFGAQYQLSL